MQEPFLKIQGLNKSYADKKALNQINLSIKKGSIYGLIGQNGAGKTTLIRILNQIIEADNGEIYLEGKTIQPTDIRKIGYLPEERGLYKNMTIEEQALYFGQLKGMTKAAAKFQLDYWLQRFDILAWKNKKLENLSKGMAQKVQFIITVLHQPSFIILDEPFSGLDPVNANLIANEIKILSKEGKTIIFSSHRMESITDMCDRLCLIHKGDVLLEGTLAEIQQNQVKNIYNIGLLNIDLEALNVFKKNTDYNTIVLAKEEGVTRLEVSSNLTIDNNQLLSQLSNIGVVQLFEQHKPTLQDIFIKTISNA